MDVTDPDRPDLEPTEEADAAILERLARPSALANPRRTRR